VYFWNALWPQINCEFSGASSGRVVFVISVWRLVFFLFDWFTPLSPSDQLKDVFWPSCPSFLISSLFEVCFFVVWPLIVKLCHYRCASPYACCLRSILTRSLSRLLCLPPLVCSALWSFSFPRKGRTPSSCSILPSVLPANPLFVHIFFW